MGDKFYPENWKRDQQKVSDFCKEYYTDYNTVMDWYYNNDKSKFCAVAEHFAKFLKEDLKSNPKKNYVVYFAGYGQYCMAKTARRVQVCVDIENAKVFRDSVQNLTEKFAGYNRYQPQFIEVGVK